MNKLYDTLMTPLEHKWLSALRQRIMPYAQGHVLEIGFGTGVNLKYYDGSRIETFTALDIKKEMDPQGPFPIQIVEGKAEDLPFEAGSFDTVVETLVLCTVEDMEGVLSEIERVLKPGGSFIFLDHVLPEDPLTAAAFKGANVIWSHLAGGCNLTRETHLKIEAYGFQKIEWGASANGIFRYGVVSKDKPSSVDGKERLNAD